MTIFEVFLKIITAFQTQLYFGWKTAAETLKSFILDNLGVFGYQLDFQIRYDKGAQTVWRRNPSVVHNKAKQKIDRSLCYLVSNHTRHCMSACVYLYHVITLNTRTLRVTIRKGKFDLKLNSKGSRGPYSGAMIEKIRSCL